MIRIGIVGTGNTVGIAHYHALGLIKDGRAEIAALYNRRPETAERWAADHGISPAVCKSYEELLDRVDAVCICAPNAYHSGYAISAAEAGKHFLVEKPMAVRIEDCRRIAAAAAETERAAFVGFVYRFSNTVKEARRIAREELGRIYTVSAWFGGKRLADPTLPMEWRMERASSGSGALGDFGSHLVDLADFVAAQRYDHVSCVTETAIPKRLGRDGMVQVENDDSATFIGKGENGIGSFTVSRIGMDSAMLMLTGEGGMLQFSLRDPESITFWEKKPGGAYTGAVHTITTGAQKPFDGWFEGEMSAFLDAIEGAKTDAADVHQGLYVEEVLYACERASENRLEEVHVI